MSTTIYDLDTKGMRQTFNNFHKTLYGRTVFFLAYFIPFVLFVTSALMLVIALPLHADQLICLAGLIFCGFTVSFILANIYFYSEVRKFVASGKNKK